MKELKFRPFISKFRKESHYTEHIYICTCDRLHRQRHKVAGTDIELIIMNTLSPDHRESHPNIGTVVIASEGAQFKVGDALLCKHFTFEKHDKTSRHFYTDEDGIEYYMVMNSDVMFHRANESELIPRRGVLLCEPVIGSFLASSLELNSANTGKRRDIARVVKTWDGCGEDEFKSGDYVMLKFGADYPIKFNGKDLLRVDVFNQDVYAKVDSPDCYDSVIHQHVDHYKGTKSINEQNGR